MRSRTILGLLVGALVLFAGSLDAEKLTLQEVAEAGGQLSGEIQGQVQNVTGEQPGEETFKEKRKKFKEKLKGILKKFGHASNQSSGQEPPGQKPPGDTLEPVSPTPATGEMLVDEWYADLPWHQKLSTKDSNLVDVPFVMPLEALPRPIRTLCRRNNILPSRCMLRYGVVNVMGMHRTDTLYQPGEAPPGQDCEDGQCVEVKLDVQRFHTATVVEDPGYQADMIQDNPGTAKNEKREDVTIPSLGFAITEATMFAPWFPWYTGHYCAQAFDGVHDAVCYEDYFTTMIQATADAPKNWLGENPDLFVPNGTGNFVRFCAAGIQSCALHLGKVNWLKNGNTYATDPQVSVKLHVCGPDHPNGPDRTRQQCQDEVDNRTQNLLKQFNASITDQNFFFDDNRHYPWAEKALTLEELQKPIQANPFIGAYDLTWLSLDPQGNQAPTQFQSFFTGKPYVLPKQCTPANYRGARDGDMGDIKKLKDCALDFEIHTSGFFEQWAPLFTGSGTLTKNSIQKIYESMPGLAANQYGRTTFLFAGIPEQQIPVSFDQLKDDLSIHDKIYGASMYTQYLPLVNPADLSLLTKSYTDQYWHNLLMSNHMNQTPGHFIRGLRGRTLWHNEFRSHLLYDLRENRPILGNKIWDALAHVDFPAGFQVENRTAPFHGNTCDSCHIRNGTGIPLKPDRTFPNILKEKVGRDFFIVNLDETYSNTISPAEGRNVPSMKIVLFDLQESVEPLEQVDANDHTTPKGAFSTFTPQYYSNTIMNFYGNSLHVNQELNQNKKIVQLPTYAMEYTNITDGDGFVIVDKTIRQPQGSTTVYPPQRVAILPNTINMGTEICKGSQDIAPRPPDVSANAWPATCEQVNGNAIMDAMTTGGPNNGPQIGFLHLLGHRLGNEPLIEMIPDQTIIATQTAQKTTLKNHQGSYGLAAGTRGGDATHYQTCTSRTLGKTRNDCYLSRFGWIGDRASLEDQIANAAIIEMNITSKESYESINPNPEFAFELVRYKETLCGPADARCQKSPSNSDILEQEIKDMATYQRWIGIPTRSEYQVSSQIVQDGEGVFRQLQCHSCHVIDKIVYVEDDNMLPDEERAQLNKLQKNHPDYPFISYLGTDLLLHEMGYLSQVAKEPDTMQIRNADGTVKEEHESYFQFIRTPALKGLRFNRFVTDSLHNTGDPLWPPSTRPDQHYPPKDAHPTCDFLLHDGRACDAIEATYLHDGPAIKDLKMIEGLNALSEGNLKALRAFLYSL